MLVNAQFYLIFLHLLISIRFLDSYMLNTSHGLLILLLQWACPSVCCSSHSAAVPHGLVPSALPAAAAAFILPSPSDVLGFRKFTPFAPSGLIPSLIPFRRHHHSLITKIYRFITSEWVNDHNRLGALFTYWYIDAISALNRTSL